MKKITDSFIFSQVMKNKNVVNGIKSINLTRDVISLDAIEEQISVINKKMKYAGKEKVIQALNNGTIKILYNPSLNLPKYLFTMLKQDNGRIVTLCDITNFSRTTLSGDNDIYVKTLFALLQASVVNYELYINWNKYTTNINIVKPGCIAYSRMIGKVLDKLYAIKIDTFKSDLIHFLIAKFFLINMCDRMNTENTDRIAYNACFNDSQYELIIDEASALPENMFDGFEEFIKALSTMGMKNLNVRIFIENYARMFGETTLLSIDYLPAFLGIIFGSAINANLAKDSIIELVAAKQVETIYPEFFKIAR